MNLNKGPEQFADVRRHVPFLAKHEGLARFLEGVLGYPTIRRFFRESADDNDAPAGVIRRLGLTVHIEGLAERIPATGPVVVVCNHAYGGADALALMSKMLVLRPDFKTLANQETTLLAGLGPLVFPVSILDSSQTSENVASIRAMLKHVRQGGALGLFPAGRVAVWSDGRMRDPEWNEQVVRLLLRMDATVIPLWFFGSPPPFMSFLSRFSGFIRTALIPTSLVRMRGREVLGLAGEPISGKDLKAMGEDAGPWLRRRLESLFDSGN